MRNQTRYSGSNRIKGFVAAAGTVFFLAACGQDEAVQTGAGAQAEELQTEELQTEELQAAGAELEDGVAGGTVSDAQAEAAEEKEQNVAEEATEETSELNLSRAQMEIDDETRIELTEQLLEENHLDTSVIEPKRSTKRCTFDLPEGFEESEEMAGMYVTGRYPLDASTIYYTAMEQDIALQLLTEEAFKEQMQESLREAYGEDIEVTVDNFENIEVSGYPAFRIRCRYQVNQIEITQLEYAINADKSYMITYSQTGDYDRMEEYEASAATIRVK
ncbi:MAG: hypothetical protein NC416_09785 [Eubacterium sp.]|nr:hypothetical protein [Eubacterium sp.]